MRWMARRALAMTALGALAGLFFACLPELSALKTAVATDAGEETATIEPQGTISLGELRDLVRGLTGDVGGAD